MKVARIAEKPRVSYPLSDAAWAALDALGEKVDCELARDDVRLTMGGEPTFVAIGDHESVEWNTAALGPRNYFAAFFRIILPMSRPVLVAAGIFTLGTIASDFTLASVFLLDAQNQTIPAGLATTDVALDELLAVAGINLMAIPIVLICAVFARGYVRGLTAAMIEGS